MFNKKNEIEIDYLNKKVDRLKNKVNMLEDEMNESNIRNDIVFCEECGVAIKKDRAEVVATDILNRICSFQLDYYCDRHAPNYDRAEYNPIRAEAKYYKDNIEVTEKGRIINQK